MELWDAYNENFEKINNLTLVRGEKIPEGLFHLVCDVLVKHSDGSYLLMKRDLNKHHGGLWEATSGGSALKGETPLECAKRELFEETGIVATNIKEVGRVVEKNKNSIYVEFICYTNWHKSNISFQKGETIAYKWVSKDTLINMKEDELLTRRIQQFIDELHH